MILQCIQSHFILKLQKMFYEITVFFCTEEVYFEMISIINLDIKLVQFGTAHKKKILRSFSFRDNAADRFTVCHETS